jgi:hypothetical protein
MDLEPGFALMVKESKYLNITFEKPSGGILYPSVFLNDDIYQRKQNGRR